MRGIFTLIVCGTACSFACAQLFDWENLPIAGTFSSVSQTVGGITATATGDNGLVSAYDWSVGSYSQVMVPFGTRSLAGGRATSPGTVELRPIRIDFSLPLSAIEVQFGKGGDGDVGIVKIWAYSSNNVLLDQESYSYGTSTGPRSMSLTGVGISYIVGDSDPTPPRVTWDNIQVTPVPEPASVAVIVAGVGVLISKRRKKVCDAQAEAKMQP